jgi:anti-sigma B factor antagonist
MKIEEQHEADNVVILDLQGKLMIGDGDVMLREKVEGLVTAGHRRIVLDLADVPYVDSAGLGEIVRCYTALSRKNGRLKLRNPSKRIHDLLSVTKLLTFFGDDDGWPEGS